MKLRNILFLLIGWMLIGCEVLELPDDTGKVNEQKVQVSFDFDGEPVALDDKLIYYNFTEVENINDAYYLTSILRKDDGCLLDCPSSFQMSFEVNEESGMKVKDVFEVGRLDSILAQTETYSYNLSYLAQDSKDIVSVNWRAMDFNGSLYDNQINIDSIDSPLIEIGLTIHDAKGNKCNVQYDLNPLLQQMNFKTVGLNYEIIDSNVLRVSHDNIDIFGSKLNVNGFHNDVFNNFVDIPVVQGELIKVEYLLNNQSGQQTITINTEFLLEQGGTGVGSIHAKMQVDQKVNVAKGILNYHMDYIDELGIVWQSESSIMPNSLEILDINDYVLNENNDKTILLDMDFSAVFFSIQLGEAKVMTDGKATMAFALPK